MTANDLFTKAAAARWVGVTPQAVSVRLKQGRLATTEVGGVTFVTRASLEAWKAERKVRADAMLQPVRP